MGFRFRKSFKICPGLRLNLGKKSSSLSFGRKGAWHTISSSGRRTTTFGIPGTGLFYTTSSGGKKAKSASKSKSKSTSNSYSRRPSAVSGVYSPYENSDKDPKNSKTPPWKIALASLAVFWVLVGAISSCGDEDAKTTPSNPEPAAADVKTEVTTQKPKAEESEPKEIEAEVVHGEPAEDVVVVPIEVAEEELEEVAEEIPEEVPAPEIPAETEQPTTEAPEPTPPVVDTQPVVSDPLASEPVVVLPIIDDPLSGNQNDVPTYEEPVYQEPTYEEPAYQEPVDDSSNSPTVYITNTGEKYHNSNCRHLADSKIPISLDEAQSMGYTACGTCH